MNPLQQIPPRVRVWLYWTGYVLGSVASLVGICWAIVAAASPDVTEPLWLAIGTAALTFLTSQFNALAGSNVSPERRPLEIPGEQLFGTIGERLPDLPGDAYPPGARPLPEPERRRRRSLFDDRGATDLEAVLVCLGLLFVAIVMVVLIG